MDGGESKKGASNKVLIGVLCGLLVLIVGLGVGIMVNYNNNNYANDVTFNGWSLTVGDEVLDCAKVDEMKNADNVGECMQLVYLNNGEEYALNKYQRLIDNATNNGDRDFWAELSINRANLVAMRVDCDEGIKLIDEQTLDGVSSGEKIDYYDFASEIAEMCGDTEKELSYRGIIEGIMIEEGIQ